MNVPGATTSGLMRPSLIGPRLLKATKPSGLFATLSVLMGLAGKSFGQPCPYVRVLFGRLFSQAPTVRQFRGTRGCDRVDVDLAIRILVHAFIAGGEANEHVAVLI